MEKLFEHLDRITGTHRAPVATAEEGVQFWRRRVLDVAMAVGLVLGSISVIPGVLRAAREGNMVLLVADVGVLLVAFWVLLARGARYHLRAGLLVAAAFGIGLVQVITSGLHTPGPLWLFAAPVLAAILFDLRVALSMVGVVIATLLIQLAFDKAGMLSPSLAQEVGSPRWTEVATDTVLLSTVVSLFMGVLLQGLRSSFQRVRKVSADLEQERAELLRTNQRLEQQIARRRQAEEERAWLATAMEQADEGIAILGLEGTIQYVNRSFAALFDTERTRLPGTGLEELGLFADPKISGEVLETLKEEGTWAGRLAVRRDEGSWQAQVSFSALRDHRDRPSHWLAVIRDVSREAELEAQLRHAQKMEAIGTLAGGIAHDFNNLLVPILGTAELLLNEADGEFREQLEDIARSARRGKDLVGQILAFSRSGDPQSDAVHLASVVEDSERLLRASLPANIRLEFDLAEPGPVQISDAQVQQVLMNLCANAFHAMRQDGGVLRVTVDRVMGRDIATAAAVVAAPPEPEQEYVRLTATDTGEGIAADELTRVFEPFYTTKAAGEGSGLGLAMIHGVALAAGGTVAIQSRRGYGTTVQVLLPRADELRVREPEILTTRQGKGERVLVVDDEEPVRTVVGRFLERLGYTATTAGPETGRSVLESESVDLLITDLSMPEIDGLELGRIGRRSQPGLPMILSTGLVSAETVKTARDVGFDHVLAKPFDMKELSEAVAGVLHH